MDRDTAVIRVQDGLGFRTDQAAKIILRMQEEQRDLERGKTLPKFLLEINQTLSLVSGTNEVNLPSNFLRRASVEIRYTPATSELTQTIPWRTFDAANATWGDAAASGPQVAVLRASAIRFFPDADRDYSLTWDYYKKGDVLTTNIENVWLANAPEIIIGGAGMRMAADLRNKTALDLFTAMYKQARGTWFSETVIDEVDDEPLLLGANN